MAEQMFYKDDSVYTEEEMRQKIGELKHSYKIVRLVDPDECRALFFDEDGNLGYGHSCFSVWGTNDRCSHCTSYQASKSNRECDRVEKINGEVWRIRSVPVRIQLKDGTVYSCTMEMINPDTGADAEAVQAEINDNNREYLLFHDILTGLYNADGMRRAVRMELEQHKDTDYVMVLTDVRRFRLVNDLFGTHAGNDVLMQIARLMKADAGERAICSRVRDDQFVVFLPSDEFDEEKMIRKLRQAEKEVSKPYYHLHLHAAALKVTEKNRNLPVSVMVDHARLALEKIRANGQVSFIWFSESMLEETIREQQIVSSFPADLERGEYTIYLQPQVDNKGNIKGAEALVRRILPDGTLSLPGDFIPVLEKSDLVTKLDAYVWEQAAKTLASWKGTELEDCCISINVSPRDAYYTDIPETLDKLCGRYDIDRKMLHVEITETGLMQNLEMHTAIIAALHEKGFVVEIDDFGKGSSSLGVLRHVSADVVKLDMSFLKDTGDAKKRDIILSSVIDMTRRLHMLALAEGVETIEQKRALEQMGGYLYQGFYFSKAVPVAKFEQMYRDKVFC